ncbi:MAG: methyltransferase domain-containing protein, partial [Alphaproteobacteria bacterium]|nr:methyltransferase domain-containing protein [Alphaproteobacteria bacterium]
GAALEGLPEPPSGVGVFEIEDGSGRWEVGAYFETAPDGIVLALLSAAWGAAPFAVAELPETDWIAKVRRELHPIDTGRFWLHGSHDAETVPPDREGLLIEAAVAFGTGHHGTTLGCVQALTRLAEGGMAPRSLADIGCGTAVLAMAGARLWPEAVLGRIVASDIDAVAVEVAARNCAVNGLGARIATCEAAGFDHPLIAAAAPFEVILANILKGPLIALAPDLARHLAPGGRAILSGLLTGQAEDVAAAYAAEGLAQIERRDIGDWATLVLGRR